MEKRKIITIDEEKCDGCGQCAGACAEGAIAIVDGKAKLVSETYCDGLGACLGQCPRDAITMEERTAPEFDPAAVHRHLAKKAQGPLPCGCPGTLTRTLDPQCARSEGGPASEISSELKNWPVQLNLAPVDAPYFEGAKLLVAADCVPFAYGDFHRALLRDRILLVGCPKLDDGEFYREKLTQIFRLNDIHSIEVAYMEVPCCFGLLRLVTLAMEESGKTIPLSAIKIGIRGTLLEKKELHSESEKVN